MTAAVPLPAIPTPESVMANLPGEIASSLGGILDAWLEAPDWRERGAILDSFLAACAAAEEPDADSDVQASRIAASVCLLTALLEQLGERDIESLPQAIAYRASAHESWRTAAVRWFAAADQAEVIAYIDTHRVTFAVLATWLRAPARAGRGVH